MHSKAHSPQRDFIWFHGLFFAIILLLLLIPFGLTGYRILALVVLYNLALPLMALRRGHQEWFERWVFLLPVSVLQIFPDWFLSAQLNVLSFPDTDGPFIGAVPLFMAGMWVIPLFIIITLAQWVADRYGTPWEWWAAGLLSLAIFAGSEAILWRVPVWIAQNVYQIAHVGLYLLIPETLLGISALLAYRLTAHRSWGIRLAGGYLVMAFYLGNVSLFYFLIERVLLK